ncbi:hypothetical protein HAZT_HAZT010569 [Hyalella azteca]|uniref:Guanylate kinase-like domain-containing protein n=1 Tax=Hyalella azteca TaxID=294128 RepID=A0A6A0HGN8_HYAAZ|nr:hypothetical protein HAZT_HAZT010569 [Hyalella azteca]
MFLGGANRPQQPRDAARHHPEQGAGRGARHGAVQRSQEGTDAVRVSQRLLQAQTQLATLQELRKTDGARRTTGRTSCSASPCPSSLHTSACRCSTLASCAPLCSSDRSPTSPGPNFSPITPTNSQVLLDSNGEKQQASIIRLSAIREIVERNKHAVLDITPSAVDRLNYAQFYPIVVYLRVESKQAVKEMRAGYPKGRQSSKKLFEQSLKVERLWGHVFTSTLTLTQPDTWPRKLAQAIAQHQAQPVWMAQSKVRQD